jgi:hypothetical protein
MALTSAIKAPDSKVTIGLAQAAVVFEIYQHYLPTHTDIRAADAHNSDVEAARKKAAWTSALFLGLVFFMTQDIDSATIGGAALAGIDLMTKHANAVNPNTGKMSTNTAPADNVGAFPLPDATSGTSDGQGY